MARMATRETRRDRGDRVARKVLDSLLNELRTTRTTANLSIRFVARELGWSHARYGRFEAGQVELSVKDLAMAGSILGLDLSAGFHPRGNCLRDAGQQALATELAAAGTPDPYVHEELAELDAALRSGSPPTRVEADPPAGR